MFRFRPHGTVAAILLVTACHPSARIATTPSPKSPATVAVRDVADTEFGSTVANVLRSNEQGGERSSRLAGIVRYQLRRADDLFQSGQQLAGLRAVRGAIWLVRAGEARTEMWHGAARPLAEAAEEAARVGDEGKTRAFYSLVKQAQPDTAVGAGVDEHIAAMDSFARTDSSQHDLETAGDQQRVAVQRSLYEPSVETLEAAGRKLVDWMRKSLQSDILERWGDASFDREEAIEAFRARRFGAMTMVGVFLRHGSPMGGLDWLERNDLGRMLPSDVRDRLEQAGEDDDSKAWHLLYQHFQNESEPSRADSSVGIELAEAAAFGTAIELYRSRPTELGSAGPLALLLPDFLLGDAVPVLIQSALPGPLTREDASWSLALIMRAMMAHGSAGEVAVARRIFADSRPILEQATKGMKSGEVPRPHPARLYAVMASLEARNAELERARDAIKTALALDPNAALYVELARIQAQLAQFDEAERSAGSAITLARKVADLLIEAEAQILRYEFESERGDSATANRALRDALTTTISARDRARQPEEQSLAERRFARILELYGEYEGAKRASRRALDAARTNHQQRTATVLDAARRALTFRDLRAVRQSLRDAIDLGISGTDCVYVALWVRLVERQLKVPSDGSVEQALARVGDLPPWPGRLKSWALGGATDAEIQQHARSTSEKTEWRFYQAASTRGGTDVEAVRHSLAEVARSHAIGLVEVSVARDLLRRANHRSPPRWPEDVSIP